MATRLKTESPADDMLARRWLIVGLLVVATTLALVPCRVQAQADPADQSVKQLSLDAYRSLVAETLTMLSADVDPGDERLVDLHRRLASVETVVLPAGGAINVQPLLGTSGPLLSAEGDTLERSAALTRLETVLTQLDRTHLDNTHERVRVLSEVLARPEFNQPESLWDRVRRWLRDLLRALLPEGLPEPNQPVSSEGFQVVAWLATAIGAVVLALLMGQWLSGLLANFIADAAARRQNKDGGQVPLTSGEARRRAAALSRTGDQRQAVRHLYLATLLLLEERGLIASDHSQTNREVLDQLQRRPLLHGQLAPVVKTFDEIWYGVREPSAAIFSDYEQAVDELTQTAMAEDQRKSENV